MTLATICDIIVMIAAVCTALAAIWKFVLNSGKGVKKTAAKIKEKEEAALKQKIDEAISPVLFQLGENTKKLELVDAHDKQLASILDVQRELLRQRIMEIYSRNRSRKALEYHEREELEKAYKIYKEVDGNSYIDKYYIRMEKWDTIDE